MVLRSLDWYIRYISFEQPVKGRPQETSEDAMRRDYQTIIRQKPAEISSQGLVLGIRLRMLLSMVDAYFYLLSFAIVLE